MSDAPSPTDAPIVWRIDVPLLGNRFMLLGFAKVVGLSGVLMAALLTFLVLVDRPRGGILPMLELTGAVTVGLFVLVLLVAVVVYRNRMRMEFRVDAEGAHARVLDRRARIGAGAAVVLGTLAGRPGVAGSGLVAASQFDRHAAWRGIARVRCHPGARVVTLANSWRTVMILFCTAETYAAVAATATAARAAAGPTRRPRASPLPKLLARTAATIVACTPFFVLPHPFTRDIFVPLLTLCFALSSLWLLPIFGWVVIGGLAWMAAGIVVAGTRTKTSMFGGDLYTSFGIMHAGDWVPLVLTALCAAYLVHQSIGLMRGRIATALADDEAELEEARPPDEPPPS